jgi:hypothetical protein
VCEPSARFKDEYLHHNDASVSCQVYERGGLLVFVCPVGRGKTNLDAMRIPGALIAALVASRLSGIARCGTTEIIGIGALESPHIKPVQKMIEYPRHFHRQHVGVL